MKFLPPRIAALVSAILNKHPEKTTAVDSPKPLKRRHLFACDYDNKRGLFIRLIHTTSSAHENAIRNKGLLPTKIGAQVLERYLQKLAPNNGPEIKGLVDAWTTGSDTQRQLVQARMGENKLHLLSLSNSEGYWDSAAENAQLDGGEIFKSARLRLVKELGRSLPPRFPDATQIMIICEIKLISLGGSRFSAEGLDDFEIVVGPDGTISGLEGGPGEIRSKFPVAPDDLEIMSIDDFRKIATSKISRAAQYRLVAAARGSAGTPALAQRGMATGLEK